MMKSVFWWRKPEYPEETTDLRQVTDETCRRSSVGFKRHMVDLWAVHTAADTDTDTGADTGFSEGGGGAGGTAKGGGGVIAPVGEKLLFEHTKFSATRGGGGDHPYHHHPLDPPLRHRYRPFFRT